MILTHGYWQRQFGGADVVGQSLNVDGEPLEIIGVLPSTFPFLNENPSILLPLQFDRSKMFVGNFSYMGVARLKPGVTHRAGQRRRRPAAADHPEHFPLPPGFTRKMYDDLKVAPDVYPLAEDAVGDVGKVLWILLGTVGMVLLIACANVANLCLVRAEGRHQEFAVRTALGASRGQIARALLSESVALGLAGGVLGVALARAGLALLLWLAPDGLPRLHEIEINGVVLLFTLGISLVAGLLFGIIPVLRFGEPSVTALKEGGRSASDGPTRHRARNTLVVAEIALALVLLVVSGLMIRSFQALRAVDPGFRNPEQVQTFRIAVPEAVAADPDQVGPHAPADCRATGPRAGRDLGRPDLLADDGRLQQQRPDLRRGHHAGRRRMPPLRRYKWIGPGYVETMGNRRGGRADADVERRVSAPAGRGDQRDAGAGVLEDAGRGHRQADSQHAGQSLARDRRRHGRRARQRPARSRRRRSSTGRLAMNKFWDDRTRSSSATWRTRCGRNGCRVAAFLRELQQAVWSVNANLPVANPRSLAEIRAGSMAQTSFALTMLGIAAAVALLLGVVGIYGVIAYIAAQRTREIGVRMALGAQASDVRRLFVGHGLKLVAIGLVLGVASALALTRLMSTLLFGVGPMDPTTYVAVSLVLGTVALVATYLPARRAARVDPMVALRSDV